MYTFHLEREEDVSGTSGVGRVAEGVVFTDGSVAMRWLPASSGVQVKSMVIYDTFDSIEKVHGHGGKTRVVLHQGEP